MVKNKVEVQKGYCGWCYYFSQWQEYGVWFCDCSFPDWLDGEESEEGDDIGHRKACPNWKSIVIYNCPKHGEFIDGCNACEYEYQKQCYEEERAFEQSKEKDNDE